MSGRVPERRAQRRLALLKAAFREVAEKGFADVTLDDIARRASVSKGVTLYYFSSKEDLFRRLFAWLVDSIHERMREAVSSAGGSAERVHALVAITFPSPSKNRAFFRAFVDFCGLAARRDGFREVMERFYRGCREIDREIVRNGMRRGDFAVRDVDAAASTVRAIFDGLMMQWLAESDLEGSFSTYRERCELQLLRYLGAGSDPLRGSDPATKEAAVESPAS
ncbi:MAG TPA: TetR/AcrR family transcriptional regulator [Thermoanaerobaculia bacterium]|nr:TetR/AcrR family transcriptional regulator [Thermoanaerobaculia bacterium]